MKTVKVVAAIIQHKNSILATQRAEGDFAGGWEFPGGKIEPAESQETALVREIKEELAADITVGVHFDTVDYQYPKFHLIMDCYICTLNSDIELLEHSDARWVTPSTIDSLEWLPADLPVVEKLKPFLNRHKDA